MTPTTYPDTARPCRIIERSLRGQHGDPFRVLGMLSAGGRARSPSTSSPPTRDRGRVLDMKGKALGARRSDRPRGLLSRLLQAAQEAVSPYRLRLRQRDGPRMGPADPYAFGPVMGEMDEYLRGGGPPRGTLSPPRRASDDARGRAGHRFAVWAPNARGSPVVPILTPGTAVRHRCVGAARPGAGNLIPAIGPARSTSTRSSRLMAIARR